MTLVKKAVIDRIVDGKTAVLIVGDEEQEYQYPADKLPEDAREGTWLKVSFEAGNLSSIEIDQKETKENRRRIQEKMEKLRQRGRKPS